MAEEAIRRFARIYEVEGQLVDLDSERRQAERQELAKPLWDMWDKLQEWLGLERRLVADGGPTAGAMDYTLNHWTALTLHRSYRPGRRRCARPLGVDEVSAVGLTWQPDTEPFPEHAVIDYTAAGSASKVKAKAQALAERARARGWTYGQ